MFNLDERGYPITLIDNRNVRAINAEIDGFLKEISETEIIINFQVALTNLYPQLIPIHAFCYDAWDDIVEHLYFEMVWKTFSWKHGINIKKSNTLGYGYECNEAKHHILCYPQNESLVCSSNGSSIKISDLNCPKLIFKEFTDGIHNLSGSMNVEAAKNVNFKMVKAVLLYFEDDYIAKKDIIMDLTGVSFEVVFEDEEPPTSHEVL